MHIAWQLEDIRYLLFEHLEPRDLARLAQTCKELFELATDELWKTITSIPPLLCPLPRDFRQRLLRRADILRLDVYTAKVKHIYLESKSVDKVIRLPSELNPAKKKNLYLKSWQALWTEIVELQPASEFLPNLRRLRINNVAEELLIPFVGISGANLAQLYVKYIHNPEPKKCCSKTLGTTGADS